MARVNADALIEALQEESTISHEDWRVSRADHWGFGWVEHLSFRAKNADGTPTSVCLFLAKWSAARADYACADDAAYSRAQYEGALEHIEREGGRLSRDGGYQWPEKVWRWLWDNDQQALDPDESGECLPSRDALRKAISALGLLEPEED